LWGVFLVFFDKLGGVEKVQKCALGLGTVLKFDVLDQIFTVFLAEFGSFFQGYGSPAI
jgi:hypothetical protein